MAQGLPVADGLRGEAHEGGMAAPGGEGACRQANTEERLRRRGPGPGPAGPRAGLWPWENPRPFGQSRSPVAEQCLEPKWLRTTWLCKLSSDNEPAHLFKKRCCRSCLGPLGEEDHEDEHPLLVAQEAVTPVVARDPGMPTREERELHNITYLPFRPWCEFCVRGRGRDRYHRRLDGEEDEQAKMSVDYGFLTQRCGSEDGSAEAEETEVDVSDMAKARPLLVMKEYLKESVWAYLCCKKGATGQEWAALQINEDLTTVGVNGDHLVTKSDQENAVVDVLARVSHHRADRSTARENSVLGDSDNNGRVEKAVQEPMGLVRAVRAGLEARKGAKVDLHSAMVDWMVRHSGMLITRYWKRLCGKTSYRLIYGRDSVLPVVEFGELVMFKPHDVSGAVKPGKFEDRWERGVWLGSGMRSGENMIGTKDGTFRAGAIRRRSADKRRSAEEVLNVAGTPAEPVPGRGRRIPAFVALSGPRGPEPRCNPEQVPDVNVRDFEIAKGDVRKHGPTSGCRGFRVVVEDKGAKGHHSAACSEGMRGLLAQTEKVSGSWKARRLD